IACAWTQKPVVADLATSNGVRGAGIGKSDLPYHEGGRFSILRGGRRQMPMKLYELAGPYGSQRPARQAAWMPVVPARSECAFQGWIMRRLLSFVALCLLLASSGCSSSGYTTPRLLHALLGGRNSDDAHLNKISPQNVPNFPE